MLVLWSIFVARPKGAARRGLGMRAATVTPAPGLEIIMTGPNDGFDRVSLADLHMPLFRHQMVVGVRLVRVRAARCFSRVLQAMVVVLLGVAFDRVAMSVVRWVIGPGTALSIVGLLPLLMQLPQLYLHLQLEAVVRVRTAEVAIRVYGVVLEEAGQVVGLMVKAEADIVISMQLQRGRRLRHQTM